MLRIETRGSWREMGRQLGEEFREWFPVCLERYASWLTAELDRWRPAIAEIRELLQRHCPELAEETAGMAEALSLDDDLMLGLRYFNELRQRVRPGCSGVFIADSDAGPLLARTCDLEPDVSSEVQLLRVCRPRDGMQTMLTTYLPLTGGVGLNEHGLGVAGSSATPDVPPARGGLPIAVVNHMVMTRCRNVDDAARLVAEHEVCGKGCVELVCDASGGSMLVEFVPGRTAIRTRRRPDRTWQACTNFCFSPGLVIASGPAYLQNAYSRYGRIVHQVGEGFMPPTVDGMKQLIAEIANPGMVCHEPWCSFKTAYASIAELANGKMHICPGHPAEVGFETVSL